MPVLPLEKQVRSDRLANLASIVLLFLILVVGVALAGLGGRLGPVLLVAFAATLGLYFVFATERQRRQMKTRVVPSQQPRFISPPAVHVTNATSTLDYATPVPPAQEAGWRYFLFGFVYVVGIAVMVVGGAIPSFPLVAALIVVPALIAAFIPRARSFSVGVFIGVILCVVLPLGICFGIMAFK